MLGGAGLRRHEQAAVQRTSMSHFAYFHPVPVPASAYINLGVVQAQTGRLDEAVQTWKRGLEQWSKCVCDAGQSTEGTDRELESTEKVQIESTKVQR